VNKAYADAAISQGGWAIRELHGILRADLHFLRCLRDAGDGDVHLLHRRRLGARHVGIRRC
jgi:hypothetical protein